MTDTSIPAAPAAPPTVPDDWRDTIARHLDELGGRYVPLRVFVEAVEAEFEQADPVTAAKAAAWREAWHR